MGVTEGVVVALIAAVASVTGAWFAYRAQKQVRTHNGHDAGELIEQIAERVARVEVWLVEHIRDHANRRSG